MRLRALLPLLPLSILIACGASSEDAAEGAGAVQGGARDTIHTYAVGVRTGTAVCSGTLIAPNLVMTARHCVAEAPVTATSCQSARFGKVLPATGMTITTEPSVVAPKKVHAVADIIVPRDDAACGADIALLVLADNVPREEATPAAPLVQFPMTSPRISRAVAVIGYGATSATTNDLGRRRVREDVRVTCVPGDLSLTCLLRASEREFSTEGGVCAGDSGSGAFEQERFGRGEALVLGVLSRRFSAGDECADATYTRTDSHAAMLLAAAKRAADLGKYTLPVWAGGPADAGAPDGGMTDASADGATADSGKPSGDAGSGAADASADAQTDGATTTADAGSTAPAPTPTDPDEPTWTPGKSTTPDSLDERAKKSGADGDDEASEDDGRLPRRSHDSASAGCAVSAAPRASGAAALLTTLALLLTAARGGRRRR